MIVRASRERRPAVTTVAAMLVLAVLALPVSCTSHQNPASVAPHSNLASGSPTAAGTPTAFVFGEVTAAPTPHFGVGAPGPSSGRPASPPTPVPTRPPTDLLRYVSKTSEPLPPGYVPPDLVPLPAALSDPPGLKLRSDAAIAFTKMAEAARQQGLRIVAVSTYRSFWEQAQVYSDEVRLFGQAQADRESALPGRSEHQLGTAVDISTPSLGYQLDDSIDKHPEGIWLRKYAVYFGFVLSYPDGKEAITGYRYEPWHYRYVGVENAHAIVASGRTSTELLAEHQAAGDPLPSPPAPIPLP